MHSYSSLAFAHCPHPTAKYNPCQHFWKTLSSSFFPIHIQIWQGQFSVMLERSSVMCSPQIVEMKQISVLRYYPQCFPNTKYLNYMGFTQGDIYESTTLCYRKMHPSHLRRLPLRTHNLVTHAWQSREIQLHIIHLRTRILHVQNVQKNNNDRRL